MTTASQTVKEDSDKDGLSNLLEQELGTYGFNPDTDGDGLLGRQ